VAGHGGRRDSYAAVASVLVARAEPGDALALAHAFRARLACDECYVADLDAIAGDPPQHALLGALAGLGGRLLVDSGVADPGAAREALAHGASRVVVGLETLPSFAALRDIAHAIGSERLVFSLDLRDGEPVLRPGASHQAAPPALAAAAISAGAAAILVLDLARIGTGGGVDVALLAAIRLSHPEVELLAGGGVGGLRDLERLADAGCDAALVATALHDGRVGERDLVALRRRPRRPGPHPSDSR
jgi:phosphoribosylformimino-5-aminoimidazole carboxamide ribotide isomerase